MKKNKIIIIGAGFGGVYTVLNLLKSKKINNLEVTLIDRNNYFLFTPLLHEVASGNLTQEQVITPIRNLFSPCIKFIQDSVESIDPASNLIKTHNNTYKFDYLVIASGSQTVHQTDNNNFKLKNLNDAIKIKNHIINIFEDHETNSNHSGKLLFSVIGAGATGVELACELGEFFNTLCKYYPNINTNDILLNLISSNNSVINNFPESSQKEAIKYLNELKVNLIYNKKVLKSDDSNLIFKDGSKMKSYYNFWTIGIKPNSNLYKENFKTNDMDKLMVNKFLQTNHNNIFALGDIVANYPSDAQAATQQAKIVSKNILNLMDKTDLINFVYKEKGKLISLGNKNATGEILGINIRGRIGWFIWRTIYLTKIVTWKKKITVGITWAINLFTDRDINKI